MTFDSSPKSRFSDTEMDDYRNSQKIADTKKQLEQESDARQKRLKLGESLILNTSKKITDDDVVNYLNSDEIRQTKTDLYFDSLKHIQELEKKGGLTKERLAKISELREALEKLKAGINKKYNK